jgi:aspartate ammonia-lyase
VNKMTGSLRVMSSPSITTALVPVIGYHTAAKLAREMKENNIDIFGANKRLGIMEEDKIRELLSTENLLKLGYTLGEIAK